MVQVFKCKLSGAETFSDEIKFQTSHPTLGKNVYYYESKQIVPSDEDNEDNKVIDICHFYNLKEIEFSKKALMLHFKKHCKDLIKKMTADEASDEEKKAFQTTAKAVIGHIKANFDNIQLFAPDNKPNPDTNYALCFAEWGSRAAPDFFFMKDSYKQEKY